MSHGKRMLNAQSRREKYGDDRLTDTPLSTNAYLRGNRAFTSDGTPNRPPGLAEDNAVSTDEHAGPTPPRLFMTPTVTTPHRSEGQPKRYSAPAAFSVSPVPGRTFPRSPSKDGSVSTEQMTNDHRRHEPTSEWGPHPPVGAPLRVGPLAKAAEDQEDSVNASWHPAVTAPPVDTRLRKRSVALPTSPSLRAVVSPRTLPQHLLRLDNSVSQSRACGDSLRSTPSTMTVGTSHLLSQVSQAHTAATSPRIQVPVTSHVRGTGAPPEWEDEETDVHGACSPPPVRLTAAGLTPSQFPRSPRQLPPPLSECALPCSSQEHRPQPVSLSQSPCSSTSSPERPGIALTENRLLEGVVDPRSTANAAGELRIFDYSGFHNMGNDCYACSVLSMLLRSLSFRKALLMSPMAVLLRQYYEMDEADVRCGSGYILERGPPKRSRGGSTGVQSEEEERRRSSSAAGHVDPRDLGTLLDIGPDGELTPTVHSVLIDFVEEQEQREHFTAIINHQRGNLERRRRLLGSCLKRYAASSGSASAYARGVCLQPLMPLFEADFFTAEQEDAHEFLVALVAKLESEAETLARRIRALSRAATPPHWQSSEAAPAGHRGGPPLAAKPGDATHEHDRGDQGRAAHAPSAADLLSGLWINHLARGKLLNIIRCRNAHCGHQIASEELFINLSLTLMTRKPTPQGVSGAMRGDESSYFPHTDVPDVNDLLQHSFKYVALDEYVCDKCHQSQNQYQGACFLGSPPEVLLVQLKRFAMSFVDGKASFTKDTTAVRVNDRLEIFSLPMSATPLETDSRSTPHPKESSEGAATPIRPCYFDAEQKTLGDAILRAERAFVRQKLPEPKRSLVTEAEAFFEEVEADADHSTGRHHGNGPRSQTLPPVGEPRTPTPDAEGREDDAGEWIIEAIRSVYELRGAVLHLGSTLHFGHYVAHFAYPRPKPPGTDELRDPPDGSTHLPRPPLVWKCANDERVTTLSRPMLEEGREHCDCSYLLLYEKVQEEWTRCPLDRVLPNPLVSS